VSKTKSKLTGKNPKDIAPDLKKALDIAFKEVVPVLDREFTVEIQSNVWPWPGKTKRKNGREAGQIRNIVDLGDLKRSQENRRIDNFTWRWTWNVDYSKVVHNGAVLKQGGNYPARPWTKVVEREMQPGKILSDIIRRELDG
tara:strand:- start:4268 stop:4693 length:426 start_codon:yes stop_codon:yes gene_type:complete